METSRILFAIVIIVALRLIANKFQKSWASTNSPEKDVCADPPSIPSRDPIFGLDTVFQIFQQVKEHRRMRSTHEMIRRYGHTYQSFPFGSRTVTTIHPQNLQKIFTEIDTFGVAAQRERATEPMLGRGIVSSDGLVWADARAMIKPTFNKSQIADSKMFSAHVDRFMQLLPRDRSEVDLQPLFDRLILDASSEFIFGVSFNSLKPDCPEDSQKFLESFNYAQQGVGKRVMLGRMDFLMRDRQFWESCDYIHTYTRKHIDRAIQNLKADNPHGGPRRYILAHELVQATNDQSVVCDQLLNVLFAGRDTPAVALTNVFFCIARNPRTWEKLREEVKGLKDDDLTMDRLKSLRYLQYVIKEAMRLYPPVANTARSCSKDVILPVGGGPEGSKPVHLRRGDSVSINVYSLHRSELYSPDPESFRPERWEGIQTSWEYLPFGGGPRHCPAQQLALFWVAYTLVKMAMVYKEVRNHDPVEGFVENLKLNMESLNGARVTLIVA